MTIASTETDEWIQGICCRFSASTGWPLEYTHVESGESSEFESSLRNNEDCCWSCEVHDGHQRTGFLHIELPKNKNADRSFQAVCELAEIVSQLFNRILSATRSLETRTQEVSTLVDIGLSIPNEADLVDSLNQLLRAAVQLTGFRAAGFFLLDPSRNQLKLRAVHQLQRQQIPCPDRDLRNSPPDLEALTRGRVLLQHDGSSKISDWLPADTFTALCMAVQSDAGPIGTLWVFDRRRRTPSDRESHVLESIAAQIAAVLERIVMLKESATQHRLQQDLQVASESQTHDILSQLPDDVGFDAAAVCTNRYELGGDLCELIPLDSHRTVVVIGDASGDSVPAAIVMSAVRGAIWALTESHADDAIQTDRVMLRINRALHSITPAHQFMSLLYGVLDTNTNSFTYTNAGHPTPIFVHNRQVSTLQSHGMLIGVIPNAEYERSSLNLAAGDLLILFSDGVSEAMNHRRTMFRADGIIDAVKHQHQSSSQEALESIWSKLEAHRANGSEPDDRTLLVIKIPESCDSAN
jgi:sigma-B regulation protein RsbU (phosphoserine phosphatase)